MESENGQEKRKTLDDIIAEYRYDADAMDLGSLYKATTEYVRRLICRIAAAVERERDEVVLRLSDEVVLRLSKDEYKGMQEALSEHYRLCEMLCEMLSESRKSVGNAAAVAEHRREPVTDYNGFGNVTDIHKNSDIHMICEQMRGEKKKRLCDMFASEPANLRSLITVEELDEYAYQVDNAFYLHLLHEKQLLEKAIMALRKSNMRLLDTRTPKRETYNRKQAERNNALIEELRTQFITTEEKKESNND